MSGAVSTGPLVASATYTLSCTGSGGRAAAASATVTVAPAAPEVCQSEAIPAYFYPSAGGLWSTADAAVPGVGILVASVANGPGTVANSDYASAIAAARAPGIRVFGYVYTHYGAIRRRPDLQDAARRHALECRREQDLQAATELELLSGDPVVRCLGVTACHDRTACSRMAAVSDA